MGNGGRGVEGKRAAPDYSIKEEREGGGKGCHTEMAAFQGK